MEDKGQITEQRDIYSRYFNQNGYILFLYKKSERLASAVYMVSDFFPIDEPLRSRLREICLNIVSEILSFSSPEAQGYSSSGKPETRQKIARCIAETIALLEVAFRTNLISEMNHAVLKKEYEVLFAFLEEHGNDLAYQTHSLGTLRPGFFDIPAPRPSRIGRKGYPLAERRVRGLPAASLVSRQESRLPEQVVKTRALIGLPGEQRSEDEHGEQEKLNKRKEERRTCILGEIAKKGSVSVRDILPLLEGYSEKTVQRELLSLVHEGVLNKEGERRWSRYSLRSN